jgi:leucyl-tRNA---protein transferase
MNENNMKVDTTDTTVSMALYRTSDHPCSYLQDHQSSLLFADPHVKMTPALYNKLALLGFRRSGANIYKPACRSCNACIPVRVSAHEFVPTRSHRRNLLKNADLQVRIVQACYQQEHFELYCRYIDARHPGGGMQTQDPDQYMSFLASPWSDTLFCELRLRSTLLGVAIIDRLDSGLSAMYTFYEPTLSKRGLGTYAVLWQIQETSRLGLPWLYLGYWIKECDKMSYKDYFRPLQTFYGGQWHEAKNRR